MSQQPTIERNGFCLGERLYLREVRSEDVNDRYYQWLNDAEINQYLETRYYPRSLENIRKYVEGMDGQSNEIFMAICQRKDDRHIGNIKLGPINWIHRVGAISLLIGDKSCWGQGYGTEAISIVSDFAFRTLNLRKIWAGCYSTNKGSARAFEKAGFKEEARLREQWWVNNQPVDEIFLGLLCNEFWKKSK